MKKINAYTITNEKKMKVKQIINCQLKRNESCAAYWPDDTHTKKERNKL